MAIRQWLSPLFAGGLFGAGLIISGMTRPSKVVGFLDFFSGHWDPSLAFVMGGALLVFGTLQTRVRKRHAPLWADIFQIPERRDITASLLVGSALFGIGWGLAGFCPGPALTSSTTSRSALLFVFAMGVGMWVHALLRPYLNRTPTTPAPLALSNTPSGQE